MLIADARVVTGEEVLGRGWLETSGSDIVALGAGQPPRQPDHSAGGSWLVPGFVDMHTHGGGGASVVGADPHAVRTFVEAHRRHGTTSVVASLVTDFYDALESDVRTLAGLTADGLLAGIHLEGPWISSVRKGAHNPDALREPTPEAVAGMLEAGAGAVRMVTIAPELPRGIEAISAVVSSGAVAAVGHTDASYEVTRAAIDAGATVATHLFNAMAPITHRQPGPIVALLGDERVTVELVCDGVHLHPATVRLAYVAAGGDRVALVTDAMAAAAGPDGDYRLGELGVRVEHGVARLVDGGALAGSTLTMDRALRFAVTRAGFSVLDAVRASSVNPARILGLSAAGRLAVGCRADLVLLTEAFDLRGVMAAGQWVVGP